jgi:hypothetical protein
MTAFNTQVCKTADDLSVATNALLHDSPGMVKGEIHKTSDFQLQKLICPALALLAL